jgi:hypothetical protein
VNDDGRIKKLLFSFFFRRWLVAAGYNTVVLWQCSDEFDNSKLLLVCLPLQYRILYSCADVASICKYCKFSILSVFGRAHTVHTGE